MENLNVQNYNCQELDHETAKDLNGGFIFGGSNAAAGPLDGIFAALTGVLGGLPVVGGIATTVLNLVKGLLGGLPLPI